MIAPIAAAVAPGGSTLTPAPGSAPASCSGGAGMRVVPCSASGWLELRWRAHLMRARPDKRLGQRKEYANQAGLTSFVNPDMVWGTLHQGVALYQHLTEPLARAIFIIFLVSEAHPCDDGNGLLARLMMDAELLSPGQCRIIVTTRAREATWMRYAA